MSCAQKSSTRECPFVNSQRVVPGDGTKYPEGIFWSKTHCTMRVGLMDGRIHADREIEGYIHLGIVLGVLSVTDNAELWYVPLSSIKELNTVKIEKGIYLDVGDYVAVHNYEPLILEDPDTGELHVYFSHETKYTLVESGIVAECNRAGGMVIRANQ